MVIAVSGCGNIDSTLHLGLHKDDMATDDALIEPPTDLTDPVIDIDFGPS
jgi:hypothetical protein